jgi:hypothetical protein
LSWGRTGLPMGRLRPRRSYNSHSDTVPHHSCMHVFPCAYSHVLPFPGISLN